MTVKIVDQTTKLEIFNAWKACGVKSVVAVQYNLSPRTIGRIIKEVQNNSSSFLPQPVKPAPQVNKVTAALSSLKSKAQAASGRPEVTHTKPAVAVVQVKAPVKKDLVWTMGSNFITIIDDEGKTFNADSTHINFAQAREAIFKGEVERALELINIKRGVERYFQGVIRIENGKVMYKELVIDNGLTKRIVECMRDGNDFKHLVNFFENLMLNPSNRAVNELYGFLTHNDIEITEDGHFIAWKRVKSDYKDMYTGKMDNSPGKVVEMPRNMVNENSNQTCSHGLHVAAKSYIPHYGGGKGAIISCKVHPRDVVSIPTDYNQSKMRCCRYEVLKDVTNGFSHY